jgi:pectate lyase
MNGDARLRLAGQLSAAKGTIMDKTAIGVGRKRTRRAWRAVAACTATSALAIGGVLAVAGPSHAQTSPGNQALVSLKNAATGQCLQDNGFAGGTDNPVVTQPCDGAENQMWGFTGVTGGAIFNESTQLCLQSASRTGHYNNLHTRPCTGAAGELWTGKPSGHSGGFVIVDKKTHLCLESDQYGNAYTQVCNPAHWQTWQFGSADPILTVPSPTAGS